MPMKKVNQNIYFKVVTQRNYYTYVKNGKFNKFEETKQYFTINHNFQRKVSYNVLRTKHNI